MNKIIVQKYGGSSVSNIDKIKKIAEKIVQKAKEGYQFVIVVSAMGKSTDKLVKMAKDITMNPREREIDMLLSTGEQVSIALLTMAIHNLNYKLFLSFKLLSIRIIMCKYTIPLQWFLFAPRDSLFAKEFCPNNPLTICNSYSCSRKSYCCSNF